MLNRYPATAEILLLQNPVYQKILTSILVKSSPLILVKQQKDMHYLRRLLQNNHVLPVITQEKGILLIACE